MEVGLGKRGDARALAPHALGVTVTADPGAAALARLAADLESRGARFGVRRDDQLVAFVGEQAGDVQFGGIGGYRPDQMPLRVSAVLTDEALTVRVDEDFGWQLFVGPAKRRFHALYGVALAVEETRARTALGT